MTNLTTTTASPIIKTSDAAANMMRASQPMLSLLKFKKGRFFCGDTEIPNGREMLAHCIEWTRGWVKFSGDQVLERLIGNVASGFQPPQREELDARDERQWPVGIDGKPRDPWQYQNYLPLEDIENGERFVFVTSSTGGAIAIQKLCNLYGRRIAKGTTGFPIVGLAVGEFSSKKYGRTPRPDFPVVQWSPPDATALLDDPVDPLPF